MSWNYDCGDSPSLSSNDCLVTCNACAGENRRNKIGLKKFSLNNEKLSDILCIGSKTFHISYDKKEKKETKALFI